MTGESAPSTPSSGLRADSACRAGWIACVALALLFGVIAASAGRTKGVTYDEVLHVPAADLHLRHLDFRANPEHPPLWKYWAALPGLLGSPADLRMQGAAFQRMTENDAIQWPWAHAVMYGERTDGMPTTRAAEAHRDAAAADHLGRSRGMMLVLAIGTFALMCGWAARLAGPVAAILAAGLFALDPNLLAHAPLVCNDVAISGAILAVVVAVWSAGRRITATRLLVLGICCGVAATTKFTGLIAGPVAATLLLGRALFGGDWRVGSRRSLSTRPSKVLAAFASLLVVAVLAWGSIWAAYGFRYATVPDGTARIDLTKLARLATIERARADERRLLSAAQADARGPDLMSRAVLAADAPRLLPEAFCAGLMRAHAYSIYRQSFRLGETTVGGVWWYFPFAAIVKTPLATLAAVAIAIILAIVGMIARRRCAGADPATTPWDGWSTACLLVPIVLLAAAVLRTNLQIGVRHLFPMYPLAFIAIGVVVARSLRPGGWTQNMRAIVAAAALAIGLAVESIAAFPNYLPFFNVAAGGSRGGIALLGDSNLDWGQDLPALAAWQRAHADRTLTLAYFGTDSPVYRGIRYEPMPGEGRLPARGVLAVSATAMQWRWPDPRDAQLYAKLRATKPSAILGGTIYLYDFGGE